MDCLKASTLPPRSNANAPSLFSRHSKSFLQLQMLHTAHKELPSSQLGSLTSTLGQHALTNPSVKCPQKHVSSCCPWAAKTWGMG